MNRSPSIRRLRTSENGFDGQLGRLLDREDDIAGDVYAVVKAIVDDVRKNGDTALVRYTNEFDGRQVSRARELVLDDLSTYRDRIASELLQALEQAAARIRAFHERQKQESWRIEQDDGTVLGQQVRPLDRVGVYVPGGKAAYPSSVLMNVIPAKVAGVDDVVMVVPAPNGRVEPVVLAAAAVADVDRVISIGGAQAIAALAFGTETVPAVDKIVGPGNIYVATAKSMVFGKVGIDMIAGPSEIVIVCDGGTDPDWVAMDLFSQAEHDEDAQAILLSPDAAFLEAVAASIERLLPTMERRAIIEASLTERGALIEVESIDEALELVNHIAPEHLELSVANADELVSRVRHAGAIFVGRHTAEAVGDYCAGPNHVLPTAGTARFSSPLGVYDFQKRSSIIQCTVEGSMTLGKIAATLARGEGLTAHARAAEMRAEDGG